jgi:hypothetical protein
MLASSLDQYQLASTSVHRGGSTILIILAGNLILGWSFFLFGSSALGWVVVWLCAESGEV